MFRYLSYIIGFFIFSLGSITDFRKREVPDYINYSFILFAVLLRIFWFFESKDFRHLIFPVIWGGLFYIISLIFCHAKIWGGGDSKALIASAVLFSYFPMEGEIPFFVYFVVNVFFYGAVYSVFYCTIIALKNYKKLAVVFSKDNKLILAFILPWVLAMPLMFIFRDMSKIFFVFAVFINITLLLKIVEDEFFYKFVNSKELVEGDWIVNTIKINGKVVYDSKKEPYVEKKHLKLLKNYGKKIKIREGVPFIPSFLIGLLMTIMNKTAVIDWIIGFVPVL